MAVECIPNFSSLDFLLHHYVVFRWPAKTIYLLWLKSFFSSSVLDCYIALLFLFLLFLCSSYHFIFSVDT